jgi:replicative DNA helicase
MGRGIKINSLIERLEKDVAKLEKKGLTEQAEMLKSVLNEAKEEIKRREAQNNADGGVN